MNVIVKVLKLFPKIEDTGVVGISGYIIREEKWALREIPGNMQVSVIERLLELAAEYNVKERSPDAFTLSEVEAPGLRVVLGDGGRFESSTVLTPKPSYLRRMVFVKCDDVSNCKAVYEFKPRSQLIVYEGSISVSNLDYDLIVLECDDHARVLFPHELSQPRVKHVVKKARKKRKRKPSSKN
ncbi:MAG: hypothetical protein QXE66_04465 [Desulfurococcaceae archaeon]